VDGGEGFSWALWDEQPSSTPRGKGGLVLSSIPPLSNMINETRTCALCLARCPRHLDSGAAPGWDSMEFYLWTLVLVELFHDSRREAHVHKNRRRWGGSALPQFSCSPKPRVSDQEVKRVEEEGGARLTHAAEDGGHMTSRRHGGVSAPRCRLALRGKQASQRDNDAALRYGHSRFHGRQPRISARTRPTQPSR
jgi:hypothetical protein